jgi:hypothetical protein
MKHWGNISVLVVSLAFVVTGIYILFKAESDGERATGHYVILFFGAMALMMVAEQFLSAPPPALGVGAGRIVFQARRAQALVLGGAMVALLLIGLLGVTGGSFPVWVNWPLLLVGVLGVAVFFGTGLDVSARIEIDESGIADFRSLGVRIPWEDVERLDRDSGRTPFVEVWLIDPARYQQHRRRWFLVGPMRSIEPVRIRPLPHPGILAPLLDALLRLAPLRLRRGRIFLGLVWRESSSDEP